jgi:hypothetical protein
MIVGATLLTGAAAPVTIPPAVLASRQPPTRNGKWATFPHPVPATLLNGPRCAGLTLHERFALRSRAGAVKSRRPRVRMSPAQRPRAASIGVTQSRQHALARVKTQSALNGWRAALGGELAYWGRLGKYRPVSAP